MPKSEEEYTDAQGRVQRRKTGQDEDLIAQEKYDPALRGNTKTQEQVESSGGLGAVAARNAAKKQAEQNTAPPKAVHPEPSDQSTAPEGATTDDQMSAVRKAKKGNS